MKIIFTYLLIMFPFSLFSHDKGIDEIIKKFILEHPEVLIQSLKNYSEDIAIKNESEIKNNISEHQKSYLTITRIRSLERMQYSSSRIFRL